MKNENTPVSEKVEDRIIDYINLNAGGRLIIFKPKEAEKGAGLVVKKKSEYDLRQAETLKQDSAVRAKIFSAREKKKTKEIQLFVNSQIKISDKALFKKEININDFNENRNIYLIFTFFDVLKQDISDNICLISLEQFKKNADAIKDKNILKFESFLSPGKEDKYSEFLINKKDLSRFFLNIISPA